MSTDFVYNFYKKETYTMVTKDTGIIEAVQNHPEIMEVFAEYGLGCIG